MKRRKNVNKYRVDDDGRITNTQPKLSPKTQKMLEFMTMMSAIPDLMGESSNEEVDDENEVKVDDEVAVEE